MAELHATRSEVVKIDGDTPTMRLLALLEVIAAKDQLVSMQGLVEETGLPFRRWILWRRLMRSVERMATGETLTSAALQAGFSDSAHFSRTFLRMFGVQASALGLV